MWHFWSRSHTNGFGVIATSHIVAITSQNYCYVFVESYNIVFEKIHKEESTAKNCQKLFSSTCYGNPSATEVPLCCESATQKLTFSTTSVLLLLKCRETFLRRRQKKTRRVYRPKISGTSFVRNEPGRLILYRAHKALPRVSTPQWLLSTTLTTNEASHTKTNLKSPLTADMEMATAYLIRALHLINQPANSTVISINLCLTCTNYKCTLRKVSKNWIDTKYVNDNNTMLGDINFKVVFPVYYYILADIPGLPIQNFTLVMPKCQG